MSQIVAMKFFFVAYHDCPRHIGEILRRVFLTSLDHQNRSGPRLASRRAILVVVDLPRPHKGNRHGDRGGT
jgi:hypothetical protein